MNAQEEISYHTQRAAIELDLALQAQTVDAAQVHFRLSTLHLERSQSLLETPADYPRISI